jgi:hypothetical protein
MRLVLLALGIAVFVQSTDPDRRVAASALEGTPLLTSNSVEALAQATSLSLQDGSFVNLEPGVRFTRRAGTYTLTTHDGNKVEIETGSGTLSLTSPVTALLTDRGWQFNGSSPVKAVSLTARRHQAQDDTDENLKSMKDAAQKLKTKDPQPARKLRIRWLYAEDPFPTAELFNTPAIQQLSHLSPVGF